MRIVFEVVEHSVHLVEFTLGVNVLYAELIAVRLADRAGFVRPAVPNVRIELVDVVALLLPNPKEFVDCALKRSTTKRDDWTQDPVLV